VAISEAVKEICFMNYLSNDTRVKVVIPITVRCDNVVAIFMAENSSSGVCSQHIDTCYHYGHEHIENGFINLYL
jgi:hypothetical protein